MVKPTESSFINYSKTQKFGKEKKVVLMKINYFTLRTFVVVVKHFQTKGGAVGEWSKTLMLNPKYLWFAKNRFGQLLKKRFRTLPATTTPNYS